MKKSLIAGAGVAALGFAAMPVLGAFAATSTMTDTINVTINPGCTIVTSGTSTVGPNNTYSVTMTNGQHKDDIGTGTGTGSATNKIDINCNSTTGNTWQLTAVGAGSGTPVSSMTGTGGSIATGTATSGETSNWAMKVTAKSGITSSFADFKAVPATAAVVATGTGSVTEAFTMVYQVYISPTQAEGTYTGKVTYTLTNPAP